MALAEGHSHTIALDQSALLEVLEAPKAAIPRLWGGVVLPRRCRNAGGGWTQSLFV